jgi:hypothetical protein
LDAGFNATAIGLSVPFSVGVSIAKLGNLGVVAAVSNSDINIDWPRGIEKHGIAKTADV